MNSVGICFSHLFILFFFFPFKKALDLPKILKHVYHEVKYICPFDS